MDLDQEICLCFHVSRRKIESFIRIEQPKRVGQLAECFGAGTGCGWCRKYLAAIFDRATSQTGQAAAGSTAGEAADSLEIPDARSYAEMRREYRLERGGDSDLGPREPDGNSA